MCAEPSSSDVCVCAAGTWMSCSRIGACWISLEASESCASVYVQLPASQLSWSWVSGSADADCQSTVIRGQQLLLMFHRGAFSHLPAFNTASQEHRRQTFKPVANRPTIFDHVRECQCRCLASMKAPVLNPKRRCLHLFFWSVCTHLLWVCGKATQFKRTWKAECILDNRIEFGASNQHGLFGLRKEQKWYCLFQHFSKPHTTKTLGIIKSTEKKKWGPGNHSFSNNEGREMNEATHG